MSVRVLDILKHPGKEYYDCFTIWKLPLFEGVNVDLFQPYLSGLSFVALRKVTFGYWEYTEVGSSMVHLHFLSNIPVSLHHIVDDNSVLPLLYTDLNEAVEYCHGMNTETYNNVFSSFLNRFEDCKRVVDTALCITKSIKHLMETGQMPSTYMYKHTYFHDFKTIREGQM